MTRVLPFVLAMFLPVATAAAAAGEARRAMDEGFALFAAQSYTGAAAKFQEAAARARLEGLDPAAALYNRAGALLKAGKAAEAAEAYGDALRSPDHGLREMAHHNRGVALVAAAGTLEQADRIGDAVRLLDEALDAFESAMRIDPGDEDPKVDHELVSRIKSRLEDERRKQEQSRERKQREPAGDARVRQGAAEGVQPAARGGTPGREMTPEEARTMLDAVWQREVSQRGRVRLPRGGPVPVSRDW